LIVKPFTTRRSVLAGAGALAAIALLPGCGLASERLPDYRYRLTVEVDTPEGLRTGSSVIAVRSILLPKTLPDAPVLRIEVRGEAVTVDLGPRGVLFALLRGTTRTDWAGGAMELVTPHPPVVPGANQFALWHQAMIANRGLHVVPRHAPLPPNPRRDSIPRPNDPPNAYPMLVRFGDIADPASVALVDPDDLAASFGKGVKLRRITVELTDDAVTTGIEKRFVWWDSYENLQFDGHRLNDSTTLSSNLNHLDISRGY